VAFIKKHGKVPLASIPFFYFSFIVVILYLFAIAGQLYAGAITCLALGILLGCISIHKGIGKLPTLSLSDALWVSLIIAPYLIFYLSIPSNYLFTGWDEFSFWAASIKLIYETDSLYVAKSPLSNIFKSYPPAQQLFQYYFTKFTIWSEANVLYAQVIFILSALMSITAGVTKNRSLCGALAFLVSCTFLYYFGYDFSHIFVDQLLSVYFSACIVIAMLARPNFVDSLKVAITVFVLTLTKQVGLILALIVLVVYGINFLFYARKSPQSEDESCEITTRGFIHITIFFVLSASSIIIAFKSWELYTKAIGAWVAHSIPKVDAFFYKPMLERLGATVLEFLHRVDANGFIYYENTQTFIPTSLKHLTIYLLIASSSLIFLHPRKVQARIFCTLSFIFLGAIAYEAFLLAAYLMFFTEYEGVRLASFERYSATYYLAWVLILYSIAIQQTEYHEKKPFATLIIAISLISFYIVPKGFYNDITTISPSKDALLTRSKVAALVDPIRKNIKAGEKAYFISQNSTGFEKYIFNYLMLPYDSVWWCWSVGSKYHANDVWTCDQKLEELLQGYNYLALYRADEKFWTNNSRIFEPTAYPKTSGTFKIERSKKNISLLPITQP